MQLVITINMDNAAFDDNPEAEAANILAGLLDHYQQYQTLDLKLYDSNGNKVGVSFILDRV